MASFPHRALLLVDGYNIIGAWERLQTLRDRQGLEAARRHLIEAVVNYSAYQGFKTEIVFDAHYQKTPRVKEKETLNVAICYTAYAQTADSYIEKICANFYRLNPPPAPRLIVATSDQAQRLTAIGYGAEWFSAEQFQVEVENNLPKHQYRPTTAKAKTPRLINRLDPRTQAILSQWHKLQ